MFAFRNIFYGVFMLRRCEMFVKASWPRLAQRLRWAYAAPYIETLYVYNEKLPVTKLIILTVQAMCDNWYRL